MSKQRISEFDIIKGIGILLVVIGHLNIPGFVRNWIFSFHMPLFFFISGFFFKPDRTIIAIIKKRTKSLLVPYIFFYIVNFFLFCFLDKSYLSNFSFTIGQNIALWFLPILFISELLFKLVFRYRVVCSILFFVLSIINATLGVVDLQVLYLIVWGEALYGTGFLIKEYNILELLQKHKKNLLVISGIASITVSFFVTPSLNVLFNIVGNPIMTPLGIFFGCIFIYCIAVSDVLSSFSIIRNGLIWLGANTLFILCMHQVIYKYMQTYIATSMCPLSVLLLLRIVFSWALMIGLTLFCNKYLKFLVGK